MDALLSLRTLSVAFGPVEAIRDVSLDLHKGQTLALVGESGSGKTTVALAALGLLPPGAAVAGSVRFDGQEVLGADAKVLRSIRGCRAGMVFQEPLSALNPLHSVEKQIGEVLTLHAGLTGAARRTRVLELLEMVELEGLRGRLDALPHTLSGGQRQRVMIAMALAAGPELLIADEPTTALDVTVQAQIVALLRGLRERLGMAMLLITHDLRIVERLAGRVAIMQGGRVVEEGATGAVLSAPRESYTQQLLAARDLGPGPCGAQGITVRRLGPQDWEIYRDMRLEALAAHPAFYLLTHAQAAAEPDTYWQDRVAQDDAPLFGLCDGPRLVGIGGVFWPPGDDTPRLCQGYIAAPYRRRGLSRLLYAARIDWARSVGSVALTAGHDKNNTACRGAMLAAGLHPTYVTQQKRSDSTPTTTQHYRLELAPPLLSTRGLVVRFPRSKTVLGRTKEWAVAVDSADIAVQEGQTLGIVGESGSGKTTLGLALLRLAKASSGQVTFAGAPVPQNPGRAFRARAQIVFQDPYGALSPRMTVGGIIQEGLRVHAPRLRAAEREARVSQALRDVEMGPDAHHRYPHAFSGGQRQRIAIARALILEPRVLILDEPTSALDLSVQSRVIALLRRLQADKGLAYVFISHDLAVIRAVAHRVAVMKDGVIVEQGPATDVLSAPRHPYTRALMDAA
ncbi:MAG TPA: hypothetical protein DDX54_02855 [Rhodospirillaceae bacterium]|jgi:peptide/nickel transport system ATP-binding protein|nr:dipeptide ABC transporter ATP-binding protein [Alphaproteobacteria bacterium]HBH26324.1 hypothetical protein [Rhodospirillaceae bacterium]